MISTKGMDKYNMIQILNHDLENSIKVASVDAITKNMRAEFEAQIRPLIKEEVEKMTFHGINHIKDTLQVRFATNSAYISSGVTRKKPTPKYHQLDFYIRVW